MSRRRKRNPALSRPRAPAGVLGAGILVRLEAQTHERVRERAEAEGITLSEWIRRAIRAALERESGPA